MTDSKKPEQRNVSRRNALKLLLGGGVLGSAVALPSRWTRPVVESVVLPAHAQLSGVRSYSGSGTVTRPAQGAVDPSRLLDLLVPTAVAGGVAPSEINFDICIVVTDGIADVHINLADAPCTFTGSGAAGGGPIALGSTCGDLSAISCTVMLNGDQTEATGSLTFQIPLPAVYFGSYTAPLAEGICSLPTLEPDP
jgi:hypothetical protein